MADVTLAYVAFDPGKHTGYAFWTEDGQNHGMGQTHSKEELQAVLRDIPDTVRTVIVEDFILYPNKAGDQAGQRMHASEAIGLIEGWAIGSHRRLVKQMAHILSQARLLTGIDDKKMSHDISHQFSAYNHGEWYLIKEGVKKLTV